MALIVATFYKFVALPDCVAKQAEILAYCQQQRIKGTILLAQEGINGTIAGSRDAIDAVFTFLKSDPRLADIEPKQSTVNEFPFERLKVKIKSEIVTLGKPEVNPAKVTGTYVNAHDWNQLITNPDVIVIDTRNEYEVRIGTFHKAVNPQLESFREFPAYVEQHLDPAKHQKVAMFCTGGIRCEKASAYLLQQGFQEVYHLQGGILKYLEEIPAEESLWRGECFVFDERIAVKHGLEPGSYEMCRSCGHPINNTDKTSPYYEEGIACPYCYDTLTLEKRLRQEERQRQFELMQKQQNLA